MSSIDTKTEGSPIETNISRALRDEEINKAQEIALDMLKSPHNKNNQILDQDRFAIDEIIGRGTWGRVYHAIDSLTGEEVAIKVLDPSDAAREQMDHRKLSTFKAMKNEAVGMSACSNVVPRTFDVDRKGTPYLVMPYYYQDFNRILHDGYGIRESLGHGVDRGLKLEQIIGWSRDVANGLAEMHTKLRTGNRAHCDLKPDNLQVDQDGHLLLNDLGSSTCVSIGGRSPNPRDNVGHLYTRAYESFAEGTHPNEKSDSFSFGALLYRMLDPEAKYPFEDEINRDHSFLAGLDKKTAEKILKTKMKRIPRKFRGLVYNCMRFNPDDRPKNGLELKRALNTAIDEIDTVRKIKEYAKKWFFTFGAPAAMCATLLYGAITHEPRGLSIPHPAVYGSWTWGSEDRDKPVPFDIEPRAGLPYVDKNLKVDEMTIKMATDNRNAASLLKSYMQAAQTEGLNEKNQIVTPAIAENWRRYHEPSEVAMLKSSPEYVHVARAIEVGLSKSITPEGKADLEDCLAIARIGEEKVNLARRASGSFNFRDYIQAKTSDGKYVIPQEEQRFLKTWLAYSHELFGEAPKKN